MKSKPVNGGVSPGTVVTPGRARVVSEKDLDALRYTGVLKGASESQDRKGPGIGDPCGSGDQFGAGRSDAVPGLGCR
ncbi:MAG: hypothetical protein JNL10_08280 [Verrucomicrobiales bacterium]|nr:hypothetical protein [Verrucomicrobiales bacterium]